MPKWTKERYKITFIKGDEYMVNDGKRNVYLRLELLKV